MKEFCEVNKPVTKYTPKKVKHRTKINTEAIGTACAPMDYCTGKIDWAKMRATGPKSANLNQPIVHFVYNCTNFPFAALPRWFVIRNFSTKGGKHL